MSLVLYDTRPGYDKWGWSAAKNYIADLYLPASIDALFSADDLNMGNKGAFSLKGRSDESTKKGMRLSRPRLEFRMELAPQKPGMVFDLNNLDQFTVGACTADLHPESGHYAFIGIVELISVSVSFGYLLLPYAAYARVFSSMTQG